MNPYRTIRTMVMLLAAATLAFASGRAWSEEDLALEDEGGTATEAAAPAKAGAPAGKADTKAAPLAAAKVSIIRGIKVVPAGDRVEVRVEGVGKLVPNVWTIAAENKVVLDFNRTRYQVKEKIVLGAPGLGDVKAVRGAQNKPGMARVVIELGKAVPHITSTPPGGFVISFATVAEAGPDNDATPAAQPAAPSPAPAAEAAPAAPQSGEAGARTRLLHAMVTDLPDRVRLVATADGVVKYKIASQDGGKELVLSLSETDLKWTPPRLDFKDGPLVAVRAEQMRRPDNMVKVSIKLRAALPYHVRRDQNQVVVEVERPAEEVGGGAIRPMKGDLDHKVTLNVQNEDLASLIKGLAFEAGFENVVINSKSMAGISTVTISLRDVPLAKALNLILAPNELIWKVERNVLKVAKSDIFDLELSSAALSGGGGSADDGDSEGGIVTRVFRLRYISVFELTGVGSNSTNPGGQALTGVAGTSPSNVSAKLEASPVNAEVANIVKNLLVDKKNGKVVIDGRTNSLVVTDASSNMRKIERLIRELDVPLPQVMIEARLIQVRVNKSRNLGVEWGAEMTSPSNPTVTAQFGGVAPPTSFLRTGYLGPGFNIEAQLRALESNGDAKVILNPRIATIQDRAATIIAKDTVPYQTTIINSNAGGQTIETKIEELKIPVSLYVRPHVNPNDTIGLEVEIESAARTEQVTAGQVPATSSQTAVTQLIVRNGETAVIGGLLRDQSTKGVDKWPILGDLPWFLGGFLFRRETTVIEKVELILFLTPTTVSL